MHWVRTSDQVYLQRQHDTLTRTSQYSHHTKSPTQFQTSNLSFSTPSTFPGILCSFCQVFRRQLHVSCTRFPKCFLRFCRERMVSTMSRDHVDGWRSVVYSRRSRKRDGVAAESSNPSNQLGNRDALTIRYIRQTFHELEIVTDVLCS